MKEIKEILNQFAFNIKEELDLFIKNNPQATCKDIPTKELVEFIRNNGSKYLFLANANLTNANLKGADLEFANLTNANLTNANLTNANLEFANLKGANLEFANLEFANLKGAEYNKFTIFPNNFKIKEKLKWYNKPICIIDFSKPITYTIMFGITTLSLYVALKIEKNNHFNKLSNIEKRLNETCFKWNKGCNEELGNCICEVKALSCHINYIINK